MCKLLGVVYEFIYIYAHICTYICIYIYIKNMTHYENSMLVTITVYDDVK